VPLVKGTVSDSETLEIMVLGEVSKEICADSCCFNSKQNWL